VQGVVSLGLLEPRDVQVQVKAIILKAWRNAEKRKAVGKALGGGGGDQRQVIPGGQAMGSKIAKNARCIKPKRECTTWGMKASLVDIVTKG
jgi:hypothetical protein